MPTSCAQWVQKHRSTNIETFLKSKGLTSRIHRQGRRNNSRSKVRIRTEHIFGCPLWLGACKKRRP